MPRIPKKPELPLNQRSVAELVKDLKEFELVVKTLKPAYDKLYEPYPPNGIYGVSMRIENRDLNRKLMRLEATLARTVNYAGYMIDEIKEELRKRKERRGA
jgi:hypothetical protein